MYRKGLMFSYTSFANTVNGANSSVYILIDKIRNKYGTRKHNNCNIALLKQSKYAVVRGKYTDTEINI